MRSAYELMWLAQGSEAEDSLINSLLLKSQLEKLSRKQVKLLDIVLDDMENKALVAELKKMTEKKQELQDWIKTLENEGEHNFCKQSRFNEMREWLDGQSVGFTEYDDIITRKMI